MKIAYLIRSLISPSRLFVRYDISHNATDRTPVVIFLHGIGNNAQTWHDILHSISVDRVRYIALDLLGFGESPKPTWEAYDAKSHAHALDRTLRRMQINKRQPLIIVGHSLGALVAIEYARKHPRKVTQLILCSPPFYQPLQHTSTRLIPKDELYRKLYQAIRKRSDALVQPAKLYSQYLSLNKGRDINENTLPAFIKSLEASVENQSSIEYTKKLTVSTAILYGTFDLLLIKKNLEEVRRENVSHISLHSIAAGHEITGLYTHYLIKFLKKLLTTYREPNHPK